MRGRVGICQGLRSRTLSRRQQGSYAHGGFLGSKGSGRETCPVAIQQAKRRFRVTTRQRPTCEFEGRDLQREAAVERRDGCVQVKWCR
jgi:hypothetical protein